MSQCVVFEAYQGEGSNTFKQQVFTLTTVLLLTSDRVIIEQASAECIRSATDLMKRLWNGLSGAVTLRGCPSGGF